MDRNHTNHYRPCVHDLLSDKHLSHINIYSSELVTTLVDPELLQKCRAGSNRNSYWPFALVRQEILVNYFP